MLLFKFNYTANIRTVVHAATMRGMMKYSFPRAIFGMQVCSMLQQTLQHHEIGTFARIMQRRLVEIVDSIDVGATLQQQTNNGNITAKARSVKTNLAVESWQSQLAHYIRQCDNYSRN